MKTKGDIRKKGKIARMKLLGVDPSFRHNKRRCPVQNETACSS